MLSRKCLCYTETVSSSALKSKTRRNNSQNIQFKIHMVSKKIIINLFLQHVPSCQYFGVVNYSNNVCNLSEDPQHCTVHVALKVCTSQGMRYASISRISGRISYRETLMFILRVKQSPKISRVGKIQGIYC
jgi:hypothetical protein